MQIHQATTILPPANVYVLVHLNKDNWRDTDMQGLYWKVAKLVYGISRAERELLPDSAERKRTYHSADEHGNNLVPYMWSEFGPSQYFGQEVTEWCHLPHNHH